MARKLFGTNGIRGTANADPMTAETALRVGMAAGKIFTQYRSHHGAAAWIGLVLNVEEQTLRSPAYNVGVSGVR